MFSSNKRARKVVLKFLEQLECKGMSKFTIQKLWLLACFCTHCDSAIPYSAISSSSCRIELRMAVKSPVLSRKTRKKQFLLRKKQSVFQY